MENTQSPSVDLESKRIAVIGAGPIGCLMSLQLEELGFKVDLYEKREVGSDKPLVSNGRNRNFAIHKRAFDALAQAGISYDTLAERSAILKKVVIHLPNMTKDLPF